MLWKATAADMKGLTDVQTNRKTGLGTSFDQHSSLPKLHLSHTLSSPPFCQVTCLIAYVLVVYAIGGPTQEHVMPCRQLQLTAREVMLAKVAKMELLSAKM